MEVQQFTWLPTNGKYLDAIIVICLDINITYKCPLDWYVSFFAFHFYMILWHQRFGTLCVSCSFKLASFNKSEWEFLIALSQAVNLNNMLDIYLFYPGAI